MARAGAFIDRLEWLKRSQGAGDGFGQKADSFASQGHLWCAVEDVSGNRAGAKGSDRQQLAATVRVRNYPELVAGDRLRDAVRDQTWTIKSVVWGDNETVCQVTAPKWTAGGGSGE